jgi:hypothetical protein
MAKGKETKRHTLIQKSIHNQLKIDPRTNPTKKPGLDSGTPEGFVYVFKGAKTYIILFYKAQS